MKPELSIVLPGIRTKNWLKLYNSILKSTKRSFELIFCGPFLLPVEMLNLNNVKYVRDFGSPVRCSNIAASLAEGKYLTVIADDAEFLENAIDDSMNILLSMGENYKNVVWNGYFEGINGTSKTFQPDLYYKFSSLPESMRSRYLPPDWWYFNCVIMHLEYFLLLGGYDCRYETTYVAHTDLAVRAQFDGAIVKKGVQVADVDWMPGVTGDHSPVHFGQTEHDEPLFGQIYKNPNWTVNVPDLKLDNWKDSPSKWERRFK